MTAMKELRKPAPPRKPGESRDAAKYRSYIGSAIVLIVILYSIWSALADGGML